MADNNSKDETYLSVRTPWGDLVKIQGIQTTLDSIRDDLSAVSNRIRELEKGSNGRNSPSTVSPMNETAIKTLSSRVDSLQNEYLSLTNKIMALERIKPLPQLASPSPPADVTKILSSFETRIVQVENKMRELDAKFEKFSTKTLQILEQLRKGSF